MGVYLDPQNRAFAENVSKGQPLYEKTYKEARSVLEGIQNFKPAADINIEEIKISTKQAGDVTTVIFRPANAEEPLPVIFYTHGGGWILGRQAIATGLTI
jgi:acetyl esterase/lipase